MDSEARRAAWAASVPYFVAATVVAGALAVLFPAAQEVMLLVLGAVGFGGVAAGVLAARYARDKAGTAEAALTQRDLVQLESQRHRDALDELAEGLDVMIFLTDRNGTVMYANWKAVEAFRFPQPVGRPILAVTLSNEIERLIREAAQTKLSQRAEITFNHPTERVGVVQAWGESPGFDRFFVSIYDITDLRRLERVRTDFVANVSHELRTPMTTIRAMAETLLEGGDESERDRVPRYLTKIIREVDRLTHITDDLLTLSRVEASTVEKAPVDLADLARRVVDQLSQKARGKGLRLLGPGPGALTALVNEAQFTQVLMNLVDNAINYTQEGEVEVSLHDDGDEVTLEVRDTGIGIASDHVPRIFERFYRVDKGRSRATGGTGLGLSIVRNIVETHGGRVTVESALNLGSTFRVVLPKG